MREQNQRLTRGLPAIDKRFIAGTRSALSSWLLTSGQMPFCLCKPFSRKACPGICYIYLSNPKPGHTTGRSGRGIAPRGGEGVRGWVGRDAVGSGCQEANRPSSRRVDLARRQPSLLPSSDPKKPVLDVSSEAQTNKILCKPMEERNQRLTRG